MEIIAHRGASEKAPENTLAAFRLAKEMGANWFEFDCQMSADGHVVVIHDDTVDRTTSGTGAVASLMLDELKALDAGAWHDPKFAGERIPTLAEALALADEATGIYIEIKGADDDPAVIDAARAHIAELDDATQDVSKSIVSHLKLGEYGNAILAKAVVAEINKCSVKGAVVIQAFSPIICTVIRAEAPDIRIELLSQVEDGKDYDWLQSLFVAKFLGLAAINLNADACTPERLETVHDMGLTMAAWTVNEPDEMARLATWGIDRIITDRPDLCRDVMSDQ
jgi:glycerophosphoryl diester phosphodiesterase